MKGSRSKKSPSKQAAAERREVEGKGGRSGEVGEQ